MRYDDIMSTTAPYFSYMFRGDGVRFYYNFIPASADVQTYICVLLNSTVGTLNSMENYYLKPRLLTTYF